MRPLNASQLLDVWEHGAGLSPVQRGLALLAAACPDEGRDELASLSIGQRDARLLALREMTFGATLTSVADCPACQERLEMGFETGDIRAEAGPDPGADGQTIDLDGYRVRFRLLDSHDLLAATSGEAPAGLPVLVERCILAATRNGEAMPAGQLPSEVLAAVAEGMAEADPQADVQLTLTCAACGHTWQAPFDVLGYFWIEIESWAYRSLQEVHRLAQAYGWREADILQMSAWRRQFYLSLL